MKPVKLISAVSGLHTKLHPTRVRYNQDAGVSDLVQAVNISIDNTGMPYRRLGWNLLESGEFHSLWCDGGDCFCILETASYASLMQVLPDLSVVGLRSGLTKDKRMSFVDVNGTTLYSNSAENGQVIDGISSAWPTGTYAGVDTTREFQAAPIGQELAFHLGRVLIGDGSTLWESDPHSPGMFDKVRGFWQFASDIRMIKPMQNQAPFRPGVFVSDSKAVYFLEGTQVGDYKQTRVASSPAHVGSCGVEYIELDDLDVNEEGLGVVWSSREGLYLGLPSGRVRNLTKERLTFDRAYQEGATLVCGYHVINTIY